MVHAGAMRWGMASIAEGTSGVVPETSGGVFAEVLNFLFQDFEQHALYKEVSELAAPHLAVLLYKSEKCAGAAVRWRQELESVVDRAVLPYMKPSAFFSTHRRRNLVRLLDTIVAAERNSASRRQVSNPMPWRVDTSWAG